jgi:HK97 family phage prohead protease
MKMEYRTFDVDETDTEKMRVSGYAAKYRSDSLPLTYQGREVIETIEPGAFDESLRSPDVSFYFQHDPQMPLASTLSGTLNLRSDQVGLAFEAQLANTQLGRDAMELLRVGIVRQMSFGFYVREEDMSQAGRRILRDIDLREISIVERAAYPEANIAARSISFTKARVRAFLSLRKVPPCQI